MKKIISFIIIIISLVFVCYILNNCYYVKSVGLFVKIANSNDTCTVYLSKTPCFGTNYIQYKTLSPEISNVEIDVIRDTLYVLDEYMKSLIEIKAEDLCLLPVYHIIGDKIKNEKEYWSDSTIFREEYITWFTINHRHGIYDGDYVYNNRFVK